MPGREVGGRVALRVLGLIFLPLGVLALIAAAIFYGVEAESPRTAHADGTVVAAGYAVVTFKAADGGEYRFRSRSRSTLWHVGDRVSVAYDPAAPDDAQIESLAGRWIFVLVFGSLGAVFVLVGAVMLVVRRFLKPLRRA